MKRFNTKSSPVLRANFSTDLSSCFARFMLKKNSESSPTSSVGVLWNAKEIKLILISNDAISYTVEIGNYKNSISSSGRITELTVSSKECGLSFCDADVLLPLHITAEGKTGTSSFNGFMRLCEYSPFFLFDRERSDELLSSLSLAALANKDVDAKALDLGVSLEDGSLRIFDKYKDGEENYPYTCATLASTSLDGLLNGVPVSFDMDVTPKSFPSMDYHTVCTADGAYGLMFILSYGEGEDSLFFGIQNSPLGLFAFVNVGYTLKVQIPKKLGDTFNFSAKWTPSSTLDLYVDGIEIMSFPVPKLVRSSAKARGLTIKWLRCRYKPESHADDLDVTLHNFTVSHEYTDSACAKYGISDLVKGCETENAGFDGIYKAPKVSLCLDRAIKNDRLMTEMPLLWECSDDSVISADGTFSSPEGSGKVVSLTAHGMSGDYSVFNKTFTFFAEGKSPDKKVLACLCDKNPYLGSGIPSDSCFVLDMNENSIIYDRGEVSPINRATLRSVSPLIDLMSKSYVALYSSNDNREYSRVKDFSMLQTENEIFFYNFNVRARYLKIHSTARRSSFSSSSFVGSLQDMLRAEHTDMPLRAEGNFKKATTFIVKNDTDICEIDKICTYPIEALGINRAELRHDLSDIRLRLGDKYLPMYYSNGAISFRIFELPAHSEAKIEILWSNPEALSVYDGNEVFEVQYGTKFTMKHKGAWRNSVAEMPDGSLLLMGGVGHDRICYERSVDGGHTWLPSVTVEGTEGFSDGGGFLVDKENNKVFYFAHQYDLAEKWCKLKILTSSDSGHTWEKAIEVTDQSDYLISYSDAIKLSTYDGAGPNVDYVFTTGMMKNATAESFCTTAVYSRDGGKTWQQSKSCINYHALDDGFEMGLSEETVWEKKDGTLILYARCQYPSIIRFAVAYSYDHGVTWTEDVQHFSNIFTPNTQPIIAPMKDTPVLLWGGNNSVGGSSYERFPLNLAYSEDDCETFKGIQDVTFQTPIEQILGANHNIVVNPDLVYYDYKDTDHFYMVIPMDEIRIADARRYLLYTKGAYDSFENRSVIDEGWIIIGGTPYVDTMGATDGKYAMVLPSSTSVSRPVTYTKKGSVEFDLYVDRMGSGADIELQAAYNQNTGVTAPVRFGASPDGRIYTYDEAGSRLDTPLTLENGNNTFLVEFDSENGSASLSVNGKKADIGFFSSHGEAICFINVWSRNDTSVSVDRFIMIKNG